MIEVFRTNVNKNKTAEKILEEIRKTLPGCKASFDLEDCDRVLRIEATGYIDVNHIIGMLRHYKRECEILQD